MLAKLALQGFEAPSREQKTLKPHCDIFLCCYFCITLCSVTFLFASLLPSQDYVNKTLPVELEALCSNWPSHSIEVIAVYLCGFTAN